MSKKKTLRWPSTKKQENGNSFPSKPVLPSESPSAKWYQTIAELPLSEFIKVAVDGNLSALIISGFPTEQQLRKAWEDISSDYADMIGDHEARLYFQLTRDLTVMTITLNQIEHLVKLLSDYRYPPMEKMLNDILRTRFHFTENRKAELKKCLAMSKGISLKKDLKEMQLAGMRTKFEKEETAPTREYFQAILITLSDFAKYHISEHITTYEFCERIHRLNKALETKKAKK
jgi:hypothetical protein